VEKSTSEIASQLATVLFEISHVKYRGELVTPSITDMTCVRLLRGISSQIVVSPEIDVTKKLLALFEQYPSIESWARTHLEQEGGKERLMAVLWVTLAV
jgi:hypothetical protein